MNSDAKKCVFKDFFKDFFLHFFFLFFKMNVIAFIFLIKNNFNYECIIIMLLSYINLKKVMKQVLKYSHLFWCLFIYLSSMNLPLNHLSQTSLLPSRKQKVMQLPAVELQLKIRILLIITSCLFYYYYYYYKVAANED